MLVLSYFNKEFYEPVSLLPTWQFILIVGKVPKGKETVSKRSKPKYMKWKWCQAWFPLMRQHILELLSVCGWGQVQPFPGILPGGSGKRLPQLPDITHPFSFQTLIPALTHSNIYWVPIRGQAECREENHLRRSPLCRASSSQRKQVWKQIRWSCRRVICKRRLGQNCSFSSSSSLSVGKFLVACPQPGTQRIFFLTLSSMSVESSLNKGLGEPSPPFPVCASSCFCKSVLRNTSIHRSCLIQLGLKAAAMVRRVLFFADVPFVLS